MFLEQSSNNTIIGDKAVAERHGSVKKRLTLIVKIINTSL